jgi:hypothetical protein
MELYFVCPRTGEGYTSENWRTMGELHVQEDMQGNRRLRGMVEVECPHCKGMHGYPMEELVCPWSQAGS